MTTYNMAGMYCENDRYKAFIRMNIIPKKKKKKNQCILVYSN